MECSWNDVQDDLEGMFPREAEEPVPGTRMTRTRRMTPMFVAKWLYFLVQETSFDAMLCEIGTLFGFITAALGLACLSTNRRVVTVDHMIGGHCMDMRNRKACIYLDFIDSMVGLDIWDKIIPIPTKSHPAASDLISIMDLKFELIYIDGNHTYDNVLPELQLYSKFLKPGGIICGDDCNAGQKPFLESFLHNRENFETVPAVAKAVLEFFIDNDEFEPVEVPVNQFGFRKKL